MWESTPAAGAVGRADFACSVNRKDAICLLSGRTLHPRRPLLGPQLTDPLSFCAQVGRSGSPPPAEQPAPQGKGGEWANARACLGTATAPPPLSGPHLTCERGASEATTGLRASRGLLIARAFETAPVPCQIKLASTSDKRAPDASASGRSSYVPVADQRPSRVGSIC